MSPGRAAALALALAGSAAGRTQDVPAMARVGPGTYRPLYPPSPGEKEIPVPAFLLDVAPVTNAQFRAFVALHPEWRRDRVSRLFADGGYLSHWQGPEEPGPAALPDQPVTRVSWFAAKAYCECRGARLPTESEWELAAAASETSPDGRQDPVFLRRILDWYSRPAEVPLRRAGSGPANWWGVRDLHGLVWEWILDFNAALVSSDSRSGGGVDVSRFCGGGALSAEDTSDYAAFMRVAFRSSLKASFTTGSLGFRCAKGLPAGPAPR